MTKFFAIVLLTMALSTESFGKVKIASWYGEMFNGKETRYGEIYDMNKLTAAHNKYPHNTILKVTNIMNGKSVIVRVNDTGSFGKKYGREIDLSKAAFKKIAKLGEGLAKVKIEVIRLG